MTPSTSTSPTSPAAANSTPVAGRGGNGDGHQAEHLPHLLPHHLAHLRASGLSDVTIAAAGIYSEFTVAKITSLLDCKRFPPKCLPALVFPFRDAEGRNGYCRIRPDHPRTQGGKPVKYVSPTGQPNQIYLPPGVAEVLSDPTRELILTEGEKKSLAATQSGVATIGLVGVYGWKQGKQETLLPALERATWSGRNVYIIYDSDAAEKPEVRDAESRLAAHLAQRGAFVKVVRLPPGKPGPDGKPAKAGIDDHLVASDNPVAELRRLLDSAGDPEPVEAGDLKLSSSEIDAVPEAVAFLDQTSRDGIPRLRFWRGTWFRYQGGAYRERPPSEVRGLLIDHLDQGFSKLTSAAVSNVLDALRAKARLLYCTEPPAWIGDDAPPWDTIDDVLVCRNGLVHLPTLVAGKSDFHRPATPRLFAQSVIEYDFDLNAPRPVTWLQFLAELWPDDTQSIETLQSWFGYCLTPNTRQQKILDIIGPRRSGKGTIGRTLRATIGKENVAGPTLASLGTNFGLWPMLGKSLAIISDARLGGRTDSQIVVERLLSISGEDALTIDRKNLEPLTCKLPTRLMLLSNELPRLGDASGALTGRMILLRLRESFYGREDANLSDKLLTELPGILLWSIEGWQRLRDQGHFRQPDSALEMLGDLADLASPVAAFLREQCNVGPQYEVPRHDLFVAYSEWARVNGRKYIEDEAGFGRDLRAALPALANPQHRIDGWPTRFYGGVGLK
jgi:putative DNA primase/helicase